MTGETVTSPHPKCVYIIYLHDTSLSKHPILYFPFSHRYVLKVSIKLLLISHCFFYDAPNGPNALHFGGLIILFAAFWTHPFISIPALCIALVCLVIFCSMIDIDLFFRSFLATAQKKPSITSSSTPCANSPVLRSRQLPQQRHLVGETRRADLKAAQSIRRRRPRWSRRAILYSSRGLEGGLWISEEEPGREW